MGLSGVLWDTEFSLSSTGLSIFLNSTKRFHKNQLISFIDATFMITRFKDPLRGSILFGFIFNINPDYFRGSSP